MCNSWMVNVTIKVGSSVSEDYEFKILTPVLNSCETIEAYINFEMIDWSMLDREI